MPIEPATMDPARIVEGATGDLLQNVYEGLVAFDEKNRIVPMLAERWDVSPNGKTYTFHLRPNARFHNGRPVEAQDVKYSLARALWPESRSSSSLNYLGAIAGAEDVAAGREKELSGVTALDARTVRITLTRPRGYFLGSLSYYTGWVVCREAIERNGGRLDEKAAIGTGPFKLQEYRHGAKVTLTASPNYWGARPALERIERPIVIDPSTRHLMYENGEVDICPVAASDYLRDQTDVVLKNQLHLLPQAGVNYVMMHPRLEPAFRNPRVRRAIAQSIDKNEIVRVASHGLWTRADGLVPPGMSGWNPHIRRIPFDPPAARKLLSEAGYPGGKGFPNLTLVYTQSQPERSAAASIIRASLQKNLGISVSLQEREAALFVNDRRAEKMAFYLGVWDADYLDPQNFLSTLLRSGAPLNNFGYSNPRFDSLCDRADEEADMSKRTLLYQQADQIAMDDIALFPIIYGSGRLLVKPYVRGWRRNLMGMLPQTKTRVGR